MKKTHIALLVASIFLWVVIGVSAVFVLPVFGAMFDEFGPRLPILTRACLSLSAALRSSPMIFTACFYGLLALVSAVVTLKKRKPYTVTFFIGGALVVSILGIALLLPILQLGSSAAVAK